MTDNLKTWIVLDVHRNGYIRTHMHFGDQKSFTQKLKPHCFRQFLTRRQAVHLVSELVETSQRVGWMIADAD